MNYGANYELYSMPLLDTAWQFNRNIDWRKVAGTHLSAHNINEMVGVLENAGYTEIRRKKGKKERTSITDLKGKYFVRKISQNFVLYWYEKKGLDYERPHKVTTFMPGELEKVDLDFNGLDAWRLILDKVKRCGKSFNKVFLPIEKQYKEAFKACVPPPINYGFDKFGKPFNLCYKCDVSSAYAYEGSKRLPTYEGCRRVKGRVSPTSEFPFAFHPHDMSLEILEEDGTLIDTHCFWEDPYFDKDGTTLAAQHSYIAMNGEVEEANFPDYTFLLKAATDNPMPRIFNDLYNKRKEEGSLSKEIMNFFIGFTHRSDNPEHAYIGAVIIARCIHRMLALVDKIESFGNDVILIATDSIAWAGLPMPHIWVEPEQKKMGSFVKEYAAVRMAVKGAKCYQIETKEGVKTVWSGVDRTLTENLDFGDIFTKQFGTAYIKWSTLKRRLINEKGEIL
jgi:hypothetical protein